MSLFTLDDIPPALRRYVPPGASLTCPPQGMTSEVAFVEGDAPCVIKRCRNPIYLEWLSREHHVLRALANAPLPVPRLLDYAEVDKKQEGREAWLVTARFGCGGPESTAGGAILPQTQKNDGSAHQATARTYDSDSLQQRNRTALRSRRHHSSE